LRYFSAGAAEALALIDRPRVAEALALVDPPRVRLEPPTF
jgi:hypothetical protein